MSPTKITAAIAFMFSVLLSGAALGDERNKQDRQVHLIINFHASEAGLADFSSILSTVERDMGTEPGFVSASVYNNLDNLLEFTLVEIWESREKHQEHFERIDENGAWAGILELLSAAPVMSYNVPFLAATPESK